MGFEGNILVIGLLLLGISYSLIVSKFTKNILARSIPSLLGLVVIGYMWYLLAFTEMRGFEALGYYVTGLLAFLVITGNLITNLILFVVKKNKNAKRK